MRSRLGRLSSGASVHSPVRFYIDVLWFYRRSVLLYYAHALRAMAELVDELLRYGLFLGAVFQLVCIAAVVFVPPKEEGKDVGDSSDEDGPVGEGTVVPHRPPQHTTGGGRRSRQDRKKRR